MKSATCNIRKNFTKIPPPASLVPLVLSGPLCPVGSHPFQGRLIPPSERANQKNSKNAPPSRSRHSLHEPEPHHEVLPRLCQRVVGFGGFHIIGSFAAGVEQLIALRVPFFL